MHVIAVNWPSNDIPQRDYQYNQLIHQRDSRNDSLMHTSLWSWHRAAGAGSLDPFLWSLDVSHARATILQGEAWHIRVDRCPSPITSNNHGN